VFCLALLTDFVAITKKSIAVASSRRSWRWAPARMRMAPT